MARVTHGSTPSKSSGPLSGTTGAVVAIDVPTAEPPTPTKPFAYLFRELAEDAKFLVSDDDGILDNLSELGASMHDKTNDTVFNSSIPAVYTYLGQFLDHDITFTEVSKPAGLVDSEMLDEKDLGPWDLETIANKVHNQRTSPLELQTVYGNIGTKDGPLNPVNGEMAVGRVTPFMNRPPEKDEFNDLARDPKNADPKLDRAARIGDPRNDSNLVLSQLHVAFLRAHNTLVKKDGMTFEGARLEMQRRYQWMVYHDYLETFVKKEDRLAGEELNVKWHPEDGVPFEFSAAAFRFGHAMIRRDYYTNSFWPPLNLSKLFMLTVLSNSFKPEPQKGMDTLPDYRIIEWRKFLAFGKNKARKIRPELVDPLFEILNEADKPVPGEKRLAVQDLKRGYMLRLPTGQAVAEFLDIPTELRLTEQDLRDVASSISTDQVNALQKSDFLIKTPLWYYILAEAHKQNDDKLGTVGGRIVTAVIVSFIKNWSESFLNHPEWKPPKNHFGITDLLALAGVLESK